MTLDEVRALFLLAEFQIRQTGFIQVGNQYDSTRQDPWWTVSTEFGLINIGRRKRVWEVNWEDCPFRGFVLKTLTDVTQWNEGFHAYTMPKLLEGLIDLKKFMDQVEPTS